MNNAQDDKGDRYLAIVVCIGIIITIGLIELAYRILS